jgi:hypothetical protein
VRGAISRPRVEAARPRRRESTMTRFVQICASQNDLFALDEEGAVHQYHFNIKTWVKLTANREEDGVPDGTAWRQDSRLPIERGGPAKG